MHNLFFGTSKHCFEVWVDKGLFNRSQLIEMERKVKLFSVPVGIGRLPSFSSSYGAFTANQWKNWITVFSTVTLKSVLPQSDYCCWLLFVRCCCILCTYCICKNHGCRYVSYPVLSQVYGKSSCSFNMHLHSHLKQNIFGLWTTACIMVLCF